MFTLKEQQELEARIHNWRKFYKPSIRIIATPYYTPPPAGETMQEEIIVKIPLKMQDAIKLELCWRSLEYEAAKWYLKWQFISIMKPHPLWRKLKNYGERIRSDAEHEKFHKRALEYFFYNLEKE